MKKLISVILTLAMLTSCFVGCSDKKSDVKAEYPEAQIIQLSEKSATLNGEAVAESDYTWHCDPSAVHNEVKNAPAEYYSGTKLDTDASVYIDHELYYYPKLPESGFKLQNYDGEKEWCYYYNDGQHDDYIFATLPALGNSLPTQMMYSEQEAQKNKVLHITKAGTYALSGSWDGQILIDLGDEEQTFTDQNAKVTLILDGADITCTVAPAIVFKNVFECDNAWEERGEHDPNVSTENAGVNVILADGSKNTVSGKNIYRMLKTVYKDEESDDAVKVQKKLRKLDAAFYSYVSMNLGGEGELEVTSSFEGLDSELHLTINSGSITINSQDDAINVNEDGVSSLKINGGNITLNAALGVEGDGIDSNGCVVIDGGTLNINGVTAPDSAIDTDSGIFYNDGKIIIDGQEQSYQKGSVFRETGKAGGFGGNFGGGKDFEGRPDMQGNKQFNLEEFKKAVADLDDDATIEDVLELLGMNNFRGERPDNMGEPNGDAPQSPQGPRA